MDISTCDKHPGVKFERFEFPFYEYTCGKGHRAFLSRTPRGPRVNVYCFGCGGDFRNKVEATLAREPSATSTCPDCWDELVRS